MTDVYVTVRMKLEDYLKLLDLLVEEGLSLDELIVKLVRRYLESRAK